VCPEELKPFLVPIDSIRPDPENPRTGHDLDAIAASLKELGWHELIKTDGAGVVSVGHGRLEAARLIGETHVPVLRIDEARERAIARNVADNQTSALSAWDPKKLAAALDISPLLAEMSAGLGLDNVIAGLDMGADVGDGAGDAEPREDIAAELCEKWGTEPGQLWALGEHRLLCGDSTKAEDVERVMGGEKADLVVTDPPYGVSYAEKNEFLNAADEGNRIQTAIENDHRTPEEMYAFWAQTWRTLKPSLADHCSYYMTGPQGGDILLLLLSLRDEGWTLKHMIIWAKNNHVLGRCDYHYKHEPIIYGWMKKHRWYGDSGQTSLWEIARPSQSKFHPTTKPTELYARAVANSSATKDLVLDPFSGSGTAIIACEQLGRRCRAIEISPGYVAVALQRWAEATGKKPTAEVS